jgi:hypothetical protein
VRITKKELDRRNAAFAKHYTATGDGRASARAAGYRGTGKAIDKSVARMLARGDVVDSIKDAPPVSAELATIEVRKAWFVAVAQDVAVPMRERIKAMELLCRASGDFVERIQHSGTIDVQIYLPDNGRSTAP